MMRTVAVTVCGLLVAASAAAVNAGHDLFVVSAGRLQGACTEGVCAQFRTDLWVHCAAPTGGTVTVSFLPRDADNTSPQHHHSFPVAPGQTVELEDVFQSAFGLDGVAGALRITADVEVVATARVYDVNVATNLGTGTAGQFYPALAAESAVGSGDATSLIGLAEEAGMWRSNLSLVETTGHPTSVTLQRVDADGQILFTHGSFQLRPFEAKQVNRVLQFLGGSGSMANQRVRVAVEPQFEGRVLVAASRIDSRTGDPFTIAMSEPSRAAAVDRSTGVFTGVVENAVPTLLDGAVRLLISSNGVEEVWGIAALPCGDGTVVLDFHATFPPGSVPVSESGGFGFAQVPMSYSAGDGTSLGVIWDVPGSVDADGGISGTLVGAASGGTGQWAACNGTHHWVYRAGRAGSLPPS